MAHRSQGQRQSSTDRGSLRTLFGAVCSKHHGPGDLQNCFFQLLHSRSSHSLNSCPLFLLVCTLLTIYSLFPTECSHVLFQVIPQAAQAARDAAAQIANAEPPSPSSLFSRPPTPALILMQVELSSLSSLFVTLFLSLLDLALKHRCAVQTGIQQYRSACTICP